LASFVGMVVASISTRSSASNLPDRKKSEASGYAEATGSACELQEQFGETEVGELLRV